MFQTKESPEPTSTTPIIGHKSSSSKLPKTTIFLLISLLALIGLLAYFKLKPQPSFSSYQECASHPQSVIQETYPPTCITYTGLEFTAPIPSPTPIIPTPTPNLIPSGWQTQSEQLHQISLPSNWEVSPPATSSAQTLHSYSSPDSTQSAILTLTITQYDLLSPGSLESAVETNVISQFGSPQASQSAQVSQEPGIFLTYQDSFVINALHPNQSTLFSLEFDQNFSEFADLADQILQTFAFLTPNPVLITPTPATQSANLSS